jgi:NADPH-dependent curcumin reductase CurA
MDVTNYRCVCAKHPEGILDESLFRIEECPYPGEIIENQVFLKLVYISVDSYMRVRMSELKGRFDIFKEN